MTLSLTSADMEKENFDHTPEELLKFRKMNKQELENSAYAQLIMLREVKAENARLTKLMTENKIEDIKGLKHIKVDYDELVEVNARNEKKIDSLTMTIKNKTWEHEQNLSKLINPVQPLLKQRHDRVPEEEVKE